MTFNKGDLVRFKTTGRVGVVAEVPASDGSRFLQPVLVRVIETGEDGYVYPSTLTLLTAKA